MRNVGVRPTALGVVSSRLGRVGADVNFLSLLAPAARERLWEREGHRELAAALLLAESQVAGQLLDCLAMADRIAVLNEVRSRPPALTDCLLLQNRACRTASGLLQAGDLGEHGWFAWPDYAHDFCRLSTAELALLAAQLDADTLAWLPLGDEPAGPDCPGPAPGRCARRFREAWWYLHRTGKVRCAPTPAMPGEAGAGSAEEPTVDGLLAALEGLPPALQPEGMACLQDLRRSRPRARERALLWLARLP